MSIHIRNAAVEDAPAIAIVHVDSWRSTYPGIVPAHYLAAMSYTDSASRWEKRLNDAAQQYGMFVAEDERGRIVGFADGGRERSGEPDYAAELYAIYLLKEYQHQGVGTLLVDRVVQHLREQQFQSMMVWAFEQNPSRRFYEALGGVPVRHGSIEIEGEALKEVGFGWSDLERLHQRLLCRVGLQSL